MSESNECAKETDAANVEAGKKSKPDTNWEAQCPLAEGETDDWKEPRRPLSRWRWLLLGLNLLFLVLLLTLLLLWYLRVIPKVLDEEPTALSSPECQSLRLPLCHKYRVPWTYTLYPNALGHASQSEAREALQRFEPLVSVKCHPLLPLLLCALHAPKCLQGEARSVPPCKSLCKETVHRCDFFLGVFSLSWPDKMSCEDLPDSTDPEVCVGHEQMRSIEIAARACVKGFRCDKTRCLPNSWVCDGFPDCTDGMDEKNCSNCSPDQFYCGHSTCISKSLVCDGNKDCPDGKEERSCLRLTGSQQYNGEGRLEAYNLVTDSWQPVCGDQWDTSTMSPRVCAMLGYKSVKETRLRDETSLAENRLAVGITIDVKKKMKSLFTKAR
ncbi:atrial natriuretic peptide-converting enzyme-like [Uloborus diversus]|uniref:atrial natriuretic peptide-converting enzyme-like n=1 Tax=Uloborus diversus TaxID=327109 RepID=UPI0024090C2D|nr:atrial natriuretic peptide-converting enzyme-like [Uloborus diversus]